MKIVVEMTAEFFHLAVEGLLAGVGERGMADIMDQRERFREVFIEAEDAGDCAGYLRDFESVSEPVAKVVGDRGAKTWVFVFEAANARVWITRSRSRWNAER